MLGAERENESFSDRSLSLPFSILALCLHCAAPKHRQSWSRPRRLISGQGKLIFGRQLWLTSSLSFANELILPVDRKRGRENCCYCGGHTDDTSAFRLIAFALCGLCLSPCTFIEGKKEQRFCLPCQWHTHALSEPHTAWPVVIYVCMVTRLLIEGKGYTLGRQTEGLAWALGTTTTTRARERDC